MKRCKLFIFVILTFLLILSLSGCITIPVSTYYELSTEEVRSVQFYDLREDAAAEAFYDKTCEPVYALTGEDKEAFLDDFSKLKFSDTILIVLAAVDPSFSYGDWVVRINFANGQYTFYSCAGYGETFDAEGNRISSTHLSCDEEELQSLISKYYDID